MSKQTAHEFISNYYDVEKDGQMCERKSFIRFRNAMPLDMDDNAIEDAYTAFSGKSPPLQQGGWFYAAVANRRLQSPGAPYR